MTKKILFFTFLTLTTVGQPTLDAITVTKNGSSVEPERSSETTTRSWKQNEGEDYLQKVLDSGCITDKGKKQVERGEDNIDSTSGAVFYGYAAELVRVYGLSASDELPPALYDYAFHLSRVTYIETCAMTDMIKVLAEKRHESYELTRDVLLADSYELLGAVCSGPNPKENAICQSCAKWLLGLRDRMNRDIEEHLNYK